MPAYVQISDEEANEELRRIQELSVLPAGGPYNFKVKSARTQNRPTGEEFITATLEFYGQGDIKSDAVVFLSFPEKPAKEDLTACKSYIWNMKKNKDFMDSVGFKTDGEFQAFDLIDLCGKATLKIKTSERYGIQNEVDKFCKASDEVKHLDCDIPF